MSEIAIKVENISKWYRIGLKDETPDTFSETLLSWVKAPLKNLKSLRSLTRLDSNAPSDSVLWALRDVSFEVKEGEVMGIIGRNGAGKSTLLKILSRITETTSGRVIINGRVASLLEVGTGFHPEMTGRENIYMNGTVLGMSKKEIDRRFDEIVDFSGIERFLHTPIKRYSSGMKVRLAFSVAAYLEPEILIIDEVLAVGDAEFQRKCLRKMHDASQSGRTVILVSHNMQAIVSLSNRCLLLDNGTIQLLGSPEDVVREYISHGRQLSNIPLHIRKDRKGNGRVRFTKVEFLDHDGLIVDSFTCCASAVIRLFYTGETIINKLRFAVAILSDTGARVLHASTDVAGCDLSQMPPSGSVICRIPCLHLYPGIYTLNIWAAVDGDVADFVHNAVLVKVDHNDLFGTGKLPPKDPNGHITLYSWDIG